LPVGADKNRLVVPTHLHGINTILTLMRLHRFAVSTDVTFRCALTFPRNHRSPMHASRDLS
jgi:hypothetical protein